jgi:magnesium-transporting ATPase (P-type)
MHGDCMQVLYVNMVTAVTIGLMLAAEPAESTVMQRPPRRPSKRLLGKLVIWRIFFVSTLLVVLVVGMFAWGKAEGQPLLQRHAEAMSVLVFGQIGYAITVRFLKTTSFHPKVFRGNRWCWPAIGVTAGLQVKTPATPNSVPFSPWQGEASDQEP